MRQVPIICTSALVFALGGGPVSRAQNPSAAADPDEARIEDVITASHILANEGILDSFGHVSARSIKNPDRFFMPRAMPPALVSRADIVEVGLDCRPVAPDALRLTVSDTFTARCIPIETMCSR